MDAGFSPVDAMIGLRDPLAMLVLRVPWAEVERSLAPLFARKASMAACRHVRPDAAAVADGLSAEKYLSITKTSRATATRDLADLVSLGAFEKTGQLKGTRYLIKLV